MIVFVSVVLQLICITALYALQNEVEHELQRSRHSALIVQTADETMQDLYNTCNTVRMGKDFNLGEASRAMDRVFPKTKQRLLKLKELIGDNKEEQALISRVEGPLLSMGDNIFKARRLARAGNIDAARDILWRTADDSHTILPEQANVLFNLLNREKQIEEESPLIQQDFRKKIQMALAATLLLNVGLALVLTAVFNKGLVARLKTLSDNVIRLACNQPLNPPLEGQDELASLDTAFRKMASALAEARENEQALVENAREVICSLTADIRFHSANQAIESIIGYARDELIGTRFVSIVSPLEIEETLNYFSEAKQNEIKKPLENRLICKDGSLRDFQWSVKWSEDKESFFCVAHDVTDANRIERMKQEFIAMVSHDLRSPLASIQAFHEVLERGVYGELNQAGSTSLHNIDASVARLMNLVGDLLDTEKLEAGSMSLDFENFEIADLLNESVNSVSDLAQAKQIEISTKTETVSLFGDKERLVQTLVNLLSNAIKFSNQNSSVELNVRQDGENTRFEVTDRGRGIPQDRIQTVFDRFSQVDAADSKNRQGSGLGLAICRAIVLEHHGEIGVDSKVGEGSTFWFTIPVGSNKVKSLQ